VVVTAVGVDRIRALAGPAAAPSDRRDGLDQGHELGDVVALAAGQRHRQRDPVRLGDHVVLRARRARSTGLGPVLGRPSAPAHGSCQSPPATSPAPPRRSAPPGAPRATAARPPPGASLAAAASRSSRTRTQAPAARTPTGSRYRGRTRCRTSPCGHPAACGQDDQRAAGRPAAAARSGPTTRPRPATVAAAPSARSGSTTTTPPVFPPVILLGPLKPFPEAPGTRRAADGRVLITGPVASDRALLDVGSADRGGGTGGLTGRGVRSVHGKRRVCWRGTAREN
jgi:hypothetical protein